MFKSKNVHLASDYQLLFRNVPTDLSSVYYGITICHIPELKELRYLQIYLSKGINPTQFLSMISKLWSHKTI